MPSTNTTTEIHSQINTSSIANIQHSSTNEIENHSVFNEEWYEYDDEGFIPIVCALSEINTFGSHAYTSN